MTISNASAVLARLSITRDSASLSTRGLEVLEKSSTRAVPVSRPDAPADATERQPDISTIKTEIEQSLREAAAA